MRRINLFFIGVSVASLVLVTGCDGNKSSSTGVQYRIQDIYQLYVYSGGNLSYDEFLNLIQPNKYGFECGVFYDWGAPSDKFGSNGDRYVDMESWNLLEKKNGEWEYLCCLMSEYEQHDDQSQHEHSYLQKNNQFVHWEECSICGDRKSLNVHFFNSSGECTVCGYYDSENDSRRFCVVWKNWNGEILETDYNVAYGENPSYDGENPTRLDDNYDYTFVGWTPSFSPVTQDTTYTAFFSATEKIKTFTVTWKNWNGEILEIDYNVRYGQDPSYDGQKPTKDDDNLYTYSFLGWSPVLSPVNSDITYIAQFESKPKPSNYSIYEVRDGWGIESYNGPEQRIVIPSEINGHKIVEIGDNAFHYKDKLLSVSLPDTILRIGNYAFSGCTRLYQINIPEKCVSLGEKCFAATALEELIIPESVTQFGNMWFWLSPIKKITFQGAVNQDYFVGELLNLSLRATVSFGAGINAVEDHFAPTYEQTDWKTVYVITSSGMYSNDFPMKLIYDWELLDTNRFFYFPFSQVVNGTTVINNCYLFANDLESSYSIGKTSNSTSRNEDYGTVWEYRYDVNQMTGCFYTGLDKLEEIRIPFSSTIEDTKMIGLLENVSVSRY